MTLKVEVKSALSLVGTVLKWLSVPVLIPLCIALYEGQDQLAFATTACVYFGIGYLLEQLEKKPELRIREGFLVVSLTWLAASLLGAVPYLVSATGSLAFPVNAIFEAMSGFTTTGATVMKDISIDKYSLSIMMWRQMTQWLGGMGIIVLAVAILPRLSVGGSQLIAAEAPGPSVQRLAPRIVETARRLWIVYVLLTAIEVLLLYSLHLGGMAPQMDLFNSFAHGFTTMPTGGFSPEARSIEAFTPAVQWAIIPFMFFAGTNFALLWQVGTDNPGILFDDIEFKAYFGILFVFSAVLSLVVFLDVHGQTIFSSIRHGMFQVLTIVTTTGYASTDFNQWSGMAMTLMFLGMFIGGCAGSTGGGIKIIRWVVGVKEMHRELYTTVHPRSVRPVRMGKRVLDDRTTRTIIMLILFYFFLFLVGSSLIYLDEIRVGDHRNPLEVMSTAAACLGNIGPGFGAVGPMNNYNMYSPITKLILFVLMWFGRLEIITAVVLFTPVYWFR